MSLNPSLADWNRIMGIEKAYALSMIMGNPVTYGVCLQHNDLAREWIKPPYSYAALISLAIINSNNKMTLSDIYT